MKLKHPNSNLYKLIFIATIVSVLGVIAWLTLNGNQESDINKTNEIENNADNRRDLQPGYNDSSADQIGVDSDDNSEDSEIDGKDPFPTTEPSLSIVESSASYSNNELSVSAVISPSTVSGECQISGSLGVDKLFNTTVEVSNSDNKSICILDGWPVSITNPAETTISVTVRSGNNVATSSTVLGN